MKRVSMSGSPRENVGKKDAKAQRNAGNVICVLYGGEEQISFTLPANKFDKIIFTPEVYLVDLEISGKKYVALLQDVQYHPVSDKVLHADFLQVLEKKPITVYMPVILTGTSIGVMNGGRLTLKMRKLKLKGLFSNIPENIALDITELKIGMGIQVKDVKIDKITILDNPNNLIASVKTARGIIDEEEEGEEAEGEEAEAETTESAE
ncbi:MAG: 50S ribosomal protein L25/general stress protein Ctc [Bacteroidales bacterium]|nr:50S ribosomal protein L25/general stress protein Ctc [Bacteroidales bacterium]